MIGMIAIMQTKTDEELLTLFTRSRDDAAFATLVARHGPMIYRVCRGILGDAHEAQDCSQAVFVILTHKSKSLRPGASLAAWLYKVARHVALRNSRARVRRIRHQEAASMQYVMDAENKRDPAECLSLREVMYNELAALPCAQRQAVLLRYLEDNSQEEAARLAGCPIGTLSQRASRGLAFLRERLSARGFTMTAMALAILLENEAHAAIPETLLPALRAAGNLSAGVGVTGAVSAHAAMLAQATLKSMLRKQVITIASAIVAAGVVFGGANVVRLHMQEDKLSAPLPVSPAVAENVADDSQADPVPLATRTLLAHPSKKRQVRATALPIPVPDAIASSPEIAWGAPSNNLQMGIVPLGVKIPEEWSNPFLCSDCATAEKTGTSEGYRSRTCISCGKAKPTDAVFYQDQAVWLEIHLRNVAKAEIGKLRFNRWRLHITRKDAPSGSSPLIRTCMPITEFTTAADYHVLVAAWQLALEKITPGKHLVTVLYEAPVSDADDAKYVHEKLFSNEIEIDVMPAVTSAAGMP